jgi:hypothetical protein
MFYHSSRPVVIMAIAGNVSRMGQVGRFGYTEEVSVVITLQVSIWKVPRLLAS